MPYTECAYEALKWYMKKNFEKSKTGKNNQRSSENKIFAKNANYVKKKYQKATRAIIRNIGQQKSGPDSSNCWSIRDESQGWGSPIRSRHFLSQNVWHLHKNIHSLVENEWCCPREVNISNVNFLQKYFWSWCMPKWNRLRLNSNSTFLATYQMYLQVSNYYIKARWK